MPKISVIIPVYNSAPYLEKCIISILSQDFKDFEALLIDDGSTDGSAGIIDKYASIDKRIIPIHQSNRGVSASRNYGLIKSRGEWITFVDSDDYIFEHYLSDMYSMAMHENCDLVVTGSISAPENYHSYPDILVDNDFKTLISKYKIHICCPVWGKLFKAALIKNNNLTFNESSSWSEDVMFVWEYLTLVNSVKLSSKINYFYLIRPESISKKILPTEKELSSFSYAKDLQKRLGTSFGKEFVTDHFGLHHFLFRIFRSLYYENHNFIQRTQILHKIKFKNSEISYPTYSVNDRILKFLIRNKYWYLFDLISKFLKVQY